MAKKEEYTNIIKLQIGAGAANPSPPVGPALGQAGVNIMEFCKAFNDATKDMEKGVPVPVIIKVKKDRTFIFETKKPPVSWYIKKAAKVKKGGSTVGKVADIGKITVSQIMEIAKEKIQDMNAHNEEAAAEMIKGSARSMGITVVES